MMECNKEDAIRAKEIAEKKMEIKDFAGARNLALKAQRLNPNLENISQIITICDVHCAAADNILTGNEKDWYGILKIDPKAEEASIKKQFRKFALVLHPDKNNFAGAADAFKLIGEAQRVLLDHEKRMLYDTKRIATYTSVSSNNRPTFWTVCPFCHVKYQYYIEIQNRVILCQNCKKSFTGSEINGQVPIPKFNTSGSQQKKVDNQGLKLGRQTTSDGSRKNVVSENKIQDPDPKGQGSVLNENVVKKNISKEGPAKEPKSNVKKNGKRKKKVKETSESCSSGSTDIKEEDFVVEESSANSVKFGFYDELHPRRSNLTKRKSECLTDSNAASPSKKVKADESSENPIPNAVKGPDTKDSLESKINSDKDSEIPDDAATDVETYEYPDPDFSDFDKDRKEARFAVGQIWAVYDTLDAMPRFYARISKVLSPGFKMKITWLEADPDNEDEIQWAGEGLPVSCGKFRFGHSENTEDHPMFSHLICWEKGSKRDTLKIYPRKGETWALFKDWDIKWYADQGNSKKTFEYEFVEVLSEYDDVVGVSAAYLTKVKGFTCLFRRNGAGQILIPPKEMFRFSHRVPSFRMTGEEREDVPEGSFELDPASLPADLVGVAVPKNMNLDDRKTRPSGSCSRPPADSPESLTRSKEDSKEPNLNSKCNGEPDVFEIPDAEFYNFDSDKSAEKFRIGDIWALYSDEDGLPKYYGMITKIEHMPEFALEIRWLVACLPPKNLIQWHDENMPVSCGKFKLQKGTKVEKYTGVNSFSHRFRAETTNKNKAIYVIMPRRGEVWAIYRNWSAEMTCADLENCEYDIVEVLEESDLAISVLVLEVVKGYKSVYKPQMIGGSTIKIDIARAELLRFSHQLPAFKLTEEKGGSLRGYWELDPAALPVLLLCSN